MDTLRMRRYSLELVEIVITTFLQEQIIDRVNEIKFKELELISRVFTIMTISLIGTEKQHTEQAITKYDKNDVSI